MLLSPLLFYVFYEKSGKIQKIVLDKRVLDLFVVPVSLISFMRLSYWYFKQYNDIPMSTTSKVFVGLLCGRIQAIASMAEDYKLKYVFPIIGKDFLKMILNC